MSNYENTENVLVRKRMINRNNENILNLFNFLKFMNQKYLFKISILCLPTISHDDTTSKKRADVSKKDRFLSHFHLFKNVIELFRLKKTIE